MTKTKTVDNHTGTPPNEPHVILVTCTDDALEDDYTDSFDHDFHLWVEDKLVVIRNIGSYGLIYTIYGSLTETPEDEDYVCLVGLGGKLEAQTVVTGANDYQFTNVLWRHIKAKCKNAVAGQSAKVKIEVRSLRKP